MKSKTFVPALLLSILASTPAAAEVVSGCGVFVTEGVLASDLDCSAFSNGLIVQDGGSLDLAGHVLTAGSESGVLCSGRCSIRGSGGSIVDGGKNGIVHLGKGKLSVRDITISGHARSGIQFEGRKLELIGSTLSGNDAAGIHALSDTRSFVIDSEVRGNGYGVTSSGVVTVQNSEVTGNLLRGIFASGKATIVSSDVSGNGGGVYTTRVIAADSVIVDNDASVVCASEPELCRDVAAARTPRVRSSSCETSLHLTYGSLVPESESWAVCSLD